MFVVSQLEPMRAKRFELKISATFFSPLLAWSVQLKNNSTTLKIQWFLLVYSLRASEGKKRRENRTNPQCSVSSSTNSTKWTMKESKLKAIAWVPDKVTLSIFRFRTYKHFNCMFMLWRLLALGNRRNKEATPPLFFLSLFHLDRFGQTIRCTNQRCCH